MKQVMVRDSQPTLSQHHPVQPARRMFPSLSTVQYRDNGGTGLYNGLVLPASARCDTACTFR